MNCFAIEYNFAGQFKKFHSRNWHKKKFDRFFISRIDIHRYRNQSITKVIIYSFIHPFSMSMSKLSAHIGIRIPHGKYFRGTKPYIAHAFQSNSVLQLQMRYMCRALRVIKTCSVSDSNNNNNTVYCQAILNGKFSMLYYSAVLLLWFSRHNWHCQKKKNERKKPRDKSLHKMENNITINQIRNATAYYCFIAEEVHAVGAHDAQFMVHPVLA